MIKQKYNHILCTVLPCVMCHSNNNISWIFIYRRCVASSSNKLSDYDCFCSRNRCCWSRRLECICAGLVSSFAPGCLLQTYCASLMRPQQHLCTLLVLWVQRPLHSRVFYFSHRPHCDPPPPPPRPADPHIPHVLILLCPLPRHHTQKRSLHINKRFNVGISAIDHSRCP